MTDGRGRAAGRGLGSSGFGEEVSTGGPRLATDPMALGSTHAARGCAYADGMTDAEGWADVAG
jgi:hypothetical protein